MEEELWWMEHQIEEFHCNIFVIAQNLRTEYQWQNHQGNEKNMKRTVFMLIPTRNVTFNVK